MTESVEIKFCDLCGVSIPQRDMDSGLTKTVGDKVVGACCLAKLIESGPPSFKKSAATREAADESTSTGMLMMTAVMLIALIVGFYLVDARAQQREQELGSSVRKVKGALETVEAEVVKVHGIVSALPLEGIEVKIGGIGTELNQVRQELESIKSLSSGKESTGISELKTQVSNLEGQLDGILTRHVATDEFLKTSLEDVGNRLAMLGTAMSELQRSGRIARSAADSSAPALARGSPLPKLSDELEKKVNMLSSEDPSVRWTAVDELLRSGEGAVVPYLIPSLKDEDPFVRRLCAEGFGKLRDKRTLEPLLASMEDDEAIVRGAAHRSLVKVAKHNLPFDPEASERKRKVYIQKWRQWLVARSK